MVQSTFNDSKYTQWYYDIIESAQKNTPTDYSEFHHIVPRSLGGSNSKNNIVKLTARQHFVCHLLLVKMTSGRDKFKMICAAHHMSVCHRRERYKITSITYERLKRQRSESMRGEANPMYGRTVRWTPAQRKRLSQSLLHSERLKNRGSEWRQRISEAQSRGVLVINSITGDVFGEWPNCTRAAVDLGCTRANVKAAIRNSTCIGRKLKSLNNVPHFVRWKANPCHTNFAHEVTNCVSQ
jgi:hypothetical protein